MPFNIPGLVALIKRVRADLVPATSTGALRRTDAEVLSRVHSGVASGLYQHQDYIAAQSLPDKCDEDMLLRYAQWRLGRGYRAATYATGFMDCEGQTGAPVDAGTLFQAPDRSQVIVTADTVINGVTAVPIRAVVAGAAGNLEGGTKLTAVSPVLGVSDEAVITSAGMTGGVNQETLEQLRAAVLRTYRLVPQGGSADDYETWALEYPGVTRAWTRRNWVGPGTVAVFIMCDGDDDPFPNEAFRAAVFAYLDKKRHATGELYVLAPKPKPIVYQIRLTPDTGPVRAAVRVALKALILAEASLGVTLLRSHQDEAISGAAGEDDHEMLVPAANVTVLPNEIATFGDIAWL